ncbi:sporulation integral membrane protein YtvI [Effusibacillus dendaii]|uniref:Permease n=1 Tax=Effusibacillus dendaii TaxID=2743772 RepID=A0A7I8DBJ8_9BACL|nr:sporulation integral membrane protein YtvI [Effusibacillus dendaii]BCJ86722.1 permease [Effusibacillus dendaii]
MLDFIMKYRIQLINFALFLAAVFLIYLLLKWFLPFILPLLIGILVALLIEPLVRFLHRTIRIPRWISSLIALLLVCGGGLALLVVVSAKLVIELAALIRQIPDWVNYMVNRFYGDVMNWIILYNNNLGEELRTKINQNLMTLGESVGRIGVSIAQSALQAISSIPNLLVILLLSLFISYFISKDFLHFKRKLRTFVSVDVREKGQVVYGDLMAAIGGYIRGQTILITITAVQVLAGLLILRVPYAFSLALLAAFLDILPLLGTGTLFVPWILFSLISGDFKLGIGLLILYGFVLVVRQLLEPRILAGTLGVDPLSMIVVMYAGYTAAGFIGLLLAPFILLTFQSLIKVQAFHAILGVDCKKNPPSN